MKTENNRLTREEFEILLGRFMHLETLKPVDLWNWIEQHADQKVRGAQIRLLESIIADIVRSYKEEKDLLIKDIPNIGYLTQRHEDLKSQQDE